MFAVCSVTRPSVKASTTLVEKMESKMERQAESIVKLLQDVKVLKKLPKRLRDEPREDAPKMAKSYHVSLEAPVEEPAVTCENLKRKVIGSSLTGMTSGVVKKRHMGKSGKTCGILAKDWPEWLPVESAFDLDLEWVCVREAIFEDNLASLYPTTTFILWELDIMFFTSGEFYLLFTLVTAIEK
jgi:hypothetical protein